MDESIKNCLHNIHEAFDPGKKCLGKDWRINFSDKDLNIFITSLSHDRRLFLSRLVMFFYINMRPLHLLLENPKDSLEEWLGRSAWSNFSLIIIMSILDKYTKGCKRKSFVDFLSEKLPITSADQLLQLSKEHRKTEPPVTVKRIKMLFERNLEKTEKEEIIKTYMAEKRNSEGLSVDSLQDAITHLWERIRSPFVHSIGLDALSIDSYYIKADKEKLQFFSNFSIDNFIFLSWKAIFKDMGYNGTIDTKFTKEELNNGMTKEGTKLY